MAKWMGKTVSTGRIEKTDRKELECDVSRLIVYVYFDVSVVSRNDHTMMTIPLPVCSAKSSIIGPG
jgi:hypothetical protein